MNIYKYMLNEKNALENALESDKKELEKLPDGLLHLYKIDGNYSWYITKGDKKKRRYLPKTEIDLAKQLAYKGYLKRKILDETENLNAVKSYLKICSKQNRCKTYVNKNNEIKFLLENKLIKGDDVINEWLQDKYPVKSRNQESLNTSTVAGITVRSKSEQIIVNHLVEHNIPFKYEDRIFYNGYNIYPDFTIMNPRTHKIYIWEHFGKMDDADYRNRNLRKINDYANLGFCLGEKLIITYETLASGIDEFIVDFYIEHYLL